MFERIAPIALVATIGLSAGCASVPMASIEADNRAKTFTVSPGKSNIYVYRNESLGAAIKMNVELDKTPAGQTAAKTYMMFEVSPGTHTVSSKAENASTLDLAVSAGVNYFVWQEVKMGAFIARNQLQLVDEAVGKAGVAECKLVKPAIDFPTVAGSSSTSAKSSSAGSRVGSASPGGKATVYVLQGETQNFANLLVALDGSHVGKVKTNSYLSLAVDSGTRVISSAAVNSERISLSVAAGRVYYVGQRVNAQGVLELREMSEDEARQLMSRYAPM